MDSAVTLKRDRGSPAEESAKKKAAVPAPERPCEVVTLPPPTEPEENRQFSFKKMRYYGPAEYSQGDKKQSMHVIALPQGEKITVLSCEIMQEALNKFEPSKIQSMADGIFYDLGLPSALHLPRTSLVRRELEFFKGFLKKEFVETQPCANPIEAIYRDKQFEKTEKENTKVFQEVTKDALANSPEFPEGRSAKKT